MKKLLAALLLLLLATPAHALHITGSPGGYVEEFLQQYSELKASGERVSIDGYCYSACTLVTMLRNDHVCITRAAVLGFHSASISNGVGSVYSRVGTEMMYRHFPPYVRSLLRSRGWNGISPHPNLIQFDYRTLRKFYRDCA